MEKDNSDKQKNSQWIWQGLIALAVLVLIGVIVYFAARRDLPVWKVSYCNSLP